MSEKFIKYGNHMPNNNHDGYVYSFNTSPGYDFNSHIHKCYEFIHVIQGNLIYNVEGTDYAVNSGDVIFTSPDELHSFYFPNECVYQREFIHIYPGFVEGYPEVTKVFNTRKKGYFNRFPSQLVTKYGIDRIFHEIEFCCTNIEPETDFLVLTYALQLMTKAGQILRNESPERQDIPVSRKAGAIRTYIDHNITEQISLESIANSLYMSQSYVSRMFKKETGMTVKTYLNMRRVTRAKNLIKQGKQITKDIYSECGYNDYSTFYRAFVKYVGMSPEEFKHSRESEN